LDEHAAEKTNKAPTPAVNTTLALVISYFVKPHT
jgi:hypothetical protein